MTEEHRPYISIDRDDETGSVFIIIKASDAVIDAALRAVLKAAGDEGEVHCEGESTMGGAENEWE